MKIQANNLKRQYDLHADEYAKKATEVLSSGWYILGKEVEEFEKEFLPASMTPDRSTVVMEPISNPAEDKKQDLTKTIVNLR